MDPIETPVFVPSSSSTSDTQLRCTVCSEGVDVSLPLRGNMRRILTAELRHIRKGHHRVVVKVRKGHEQFEV